MKGLFLTQSECNTMILLIEREIINTQVSYNSEAAASAKVAKLRGLQSLISEYNPDAGEK